MKLYPTFNSVGHVTHANIELARNGLSAGLATPDVVARTHGTTADAVELGERENVPGQQHIAARRARTSHSCLLQPGGSSIPVLPVEGSAAGNDEL